jgi:DNA-binding CsgD family transcriptional regulator
MDDQSFSRLIGQIYECCATTEAWPEAIAAVGAFVGGEKGHFLVFAEKGRIEPLHSVVGGVDPSSGHEYDTHYAARDPRMPTFISARNRIVLCHETVDTATFDRSEIVNDFLLKWDARYCMAGNFPIDDGCVGVWTAIRGLRSGPFLDEERRRLALVLPHVRQAVGLHLRLGLLDAKSVRIECAMDALASPVFLIDRDCRLHFANAAAEEMLREATPLCQRQGRLSGASPALTRAIGRLAARVVNGTSMDSEGAPTNDVVAGEPGSPAARLVFYPLRGPAMPAGAVGAEILVAVARREDHRPSESLLRSLFGLTRGEAQLALALARGERLRDLAEQRGVSLETVRTQLRSIFLKTDVRRQSELVLLLQAQTSLALRPPVTD